MAQRYSSRTTVLHLGDHDPSGVHIFRALSEDIRAFADVYGGEVDFQRLAVTPEQIREMSLPTSPVKATDNRSFEGTQTVQCEAIDPPDLAEIVRQGILAYTDRAGLERAQEWQTTIRSSVSAMLEDV